MQKALYVLILALFVSPVLAGCIGGGDEPEPEGKECPENICNTDETEVGLGGIKGKVLDEAFEPVPGANVTIRELDVTANADESGAYSFNNLEPGAYTIFAQAEGFRANGKQITVEADAIMTADIPLESLPPPAVPRSEQWEFLDGFISCGVAYWEVTAKDHCGDTLNDPNAESLFKFPVSESGLTGLAIYVEADDPVVGEKPALRVKWTNPPHLSGDAYTLRGPVPLHETFVFTDADTWRDQQLPTPDEAPASFNVRLDNPDLGGTPNYAYSFNFRIWIELFYNDEPMADGHNPKPEV